MNAIFRNQPHYTVYSKPIDENCALYLAIFNIERLFLEPDQQNFNVFTEKDIDHDPRTKREVTKYVYDNSELMQLPFFTSSPIYSSIPREKHKLGVVIIKQLQECTPLKQEDIVIWSSLEQERLKEINLFQEYVRNEYDISTERIYILAQHFMDPYINYYKNYCDMIKCRYHLGAYNTCAGVPHPKLYESLPEKNYFSEIHDIVIIEKEGYVLSPNDSKNLNFKTLEHNMHVCHEEYMNCYKSKEAFNIKLKANFLKDIQYEVACNDDDDDSDDDNDANNKSVFYVPLDALIFVLTAGDDVDLPTNMLLRIQSNKISGKWIIMDKPLPSHSTGFHTNKEIVEQSALALLSMTDEYKWFEIQGNQVQEVLHTVPEINGNKNENHPMVYNIVSIDEYTSNYMTKLSKPEKCKYFQTLAKWTLKTIDDNPNEMKIYTPMNYMAALSNIDNEIDKELDIITLKLEYKSQFGCEVMSKYELLKEWLRLKLSKARLTIQYRLDAKTFATLAQEIYTCDRLEKQLFVLYNVKIADLLSGLKDFLKILLKMPDGVYLVDHKDTFENKLLLCRPSEEEAPSTIYLKQLLESAPSRLMFMKDVKCLPIATDVCSVMHIKHNQLPCAFTSSVENMPTASTVTLSEQQQRVIRTQLMTKNMKAKKGKAKRRRDKRKKICFKNKCKCLQVNQERIIRSNI